MQTIRNTIKNVDERIQPINQFVAVKEIQACSLMARYFTPAVAKASSTILGDGFVNLEKTVEAVPGMKPAVMAVSRRCPSLTPIYEMLAGKISLNNALKTNLFQNGIPVPNSSKTIQDNANLLVLFSMLAYEDEENVKKNLPDWEVKFVKDNEELDTEVYVLQKDNTVIIAFRGTEGLNSQDWSLDFQFALAPLTRKAETLVPLASTVSENIQVHSGFQNALDADVMRQIVDKMKEIKNQGNPNIELCVTGHSLGGALADLSVGRILADARSDETADWMKKRLKGLYTYGQPRVGNKNYCEHCGEIDGKMFRFVLAHDIVPRFPLLDSVQSNYVHHGTLIYMQPDGKAEIHPSGSGSQAHEKVHLLLGWFDQSVKLVQNWKTDSLLRKVIRVTLPYSINDHLPSDYVEAVMALKEPQLQQVTYHPEKKQTEIAQ